MQQAVTMRFHSSYQSLMGRTRVCGVLQEKAAYKEAFARLRELKQEIEHLQMLLEQSRTKLQRDFEHWMSLMLRQQQAASAVTAAARHIPSPLHVVHPHNSRQLLLQLLLR